MSLTFSVILTSQSSLARLKIAFNLARVKQYQHLAEISHEQRKNLFNGESNAISRRESLFVSPSRLA